MLMLDQQGSAGGGASTVLTLAGLAEPLRKRFAATPEARARKLTVRHFSTASSGGRCETCEGRGYITVAMDLMPDVHVECETCGGRRFLPEVLACTLDGLAFPEVLETTVAEAAGRFPQRGFEALKALRDIGLGYLRLGQEARALSSGEFTSGSAWRGSWPRPLSGPRSCWTSRPRDWASRTSTVSSWP